MKCKLSYVSEIISGATPSTTHDEYYDGDVVWFTPKDLSDQNTKYVERGSRNITAEGFRSCSARMIPPYNLLMSSRAPIGLLSINEVECCTNQGFKSMVVDKTKADVDYLYYYIKHHLPEVEALGSGTTFKEVSRASLEKWEIDIPDLHTQKEISSILSFLDRKISLNRKANEVLEKMAKQLYDYWFVQFDFPDENGKPYKSSGGKMVYNETLKREIPEGWKVINLSETLEILKDGTHNPPKRLEQGVSLLTGYMFGDNFLDYTKATYISEKEYQSIHSTYKPQEGDIVITKIGTVGKVNILTGQDIPLAIHCNSALLRYKRPYNGLYAYWYTKSDLFKMRLFSKIGHSIQQFVNLENIGSILFEAPNENIVSKFNITMKPMYDKMVSIRNENLRLTSLRDFLLPMLMNGQVTIKNND